MTTMLREAPVQVTTVERPNEARRRADRMRNRRRPDETEAARQDAPETDAERLDYNLETVSITPPMEAEEIVLASAEQTAAQDGASPEGAPPGEQVPAPEGLADTGLTPEQVAAREVEMAAAQAALDQAQDTPSLMEAFAAAPPTMKAQVSGELGNRMSGAMDQERQALEDATPEIQVEMNGNTPPAAGEIPGPGSTDITLEEAPAESAPEGDRLVGEAVATEGDYRSNDRVVGGLRSSFSTESGSEDIERALDSVQTSDPSIVASPGTPPGIPQRGETDPQRFQNQIQSGSQQARETLTEQQQAAAALPGAERVRLADVHESLPAGEVVSPTAEEGPAPEGAQRYLEMNVPADVQAAFDQQAGPQMQQSMAETQTAINQAAEARDQQHQTEVETAQRETAEAHRQSESDQQEQVADARRQIENQRQDTREQQQAAVADAENQAEARRQTDREQFDARVRTDQEQIDGRYAQAERDAQAEVQDGERQAEARREQAERESENQSWWEAALDFITDLFDALVSAINSIFDAVRAAVNRILDAVRDFAVGLIELAANALKGLIEAFGTFLTDLVQNLLGDIFPGLAAALTGFIDRAVDLATRAIDVVAEGLVSAVNAIVETLRAGINALIDIYQSAVNTALALARAALTGDWAAFILQLLESALRLVGIDPAEMYAFIGRAQETIEIIMNDPGGFLSNALEALMGGFRRFADNFLTHLQAGIIGWLTGALGSAGITLPERFDLMGVISLVAQILGLTWENLRQRIVRFVGERGMQVIEFVAGYIQTLIEGGWSALWERIQNDLASLRDMVLEQIRNFLVERIIMAAVTRLATMFNPVGALVNILLAAYNFYTFIRDQIQRIYQVVQTIVDAVGNIARGVLGPAQERVESFLAGLLPLAIDLLARLIGLGNVGQRVQQILGRVQDTIWNAIDRMINRVVAMFRGGGGAAGEPAAPEGGAGVGAAQIGERIDVPTAQGSHTLYIVTSERGAEEMVESTPMPVRQRIADWRDRLTELKAERTQGQREADREKGSRLLTGASSHLRTLDEYADQLAAAAVQNAGTRAGRSNGGSTSTSSAGTLSQSQVVSEERALAEIIGQLFNLYQDSIGGGSLQERYQSQITLAHHQLQGAIAEAADALERKADTDDVDPIRRYPNWERMRRGFAGEHASGRPGGAAFKNLIEQPFNQHSSPFTASFSQYVHRDLLVNPLQAAIDQAQTPDSNAQYAELSNWDRGAPETFVNSQKGAMNSQGPGYSRSRDAMINMIFNETQEPPAAATFLDELAGRAGDASSSPFHALLSQQQVVDLVQARADNLSSDETWVAVFAAAGRQLRVQRAAGGLSVGDELTLERIRGSSLASDTNVFTEAIFRALTNSSSFMSAMGSPNTSQVRSFAAWLAGEIMNNIKSRPLYFVRPTDIPRNVPQNFPYVRVRESDNERVSVAPSLYGSLAQDIVNFLNLHATEIHHTLPIYLGGGHELLNLAVVFGGAGSSGTPHNMLHAVIDNIDIGRFMDATGRLTLRVEDLARHYREFNILIGVLRVDGQIEWEDTGQRLQPPSETA